jgi:uncharacterized membrane protein YkoI
MRKRTKVVLAVGVAALLATTGGIAAAAAVGDDDGTEVQISGPARQQAEAAALAHTGGGRVTGTEVGDEESMYEVEVTLEDGRQVDVQLDEAFRVVEASADHEDGPGQDDSLRALGRSTV